MGNQAEFLAFDLFRLRLAWRTRSSFRFSSSTQLQGGPIRCRIPRSWVLCAPQAKTLPALASSASGVRARKANLLCDTWPSPLSRAQRSRFASTASVAGGTGIGHRVLKLVASPEHCAMHGTSPAGTMPDQKKFLDPRTLYPGGIGFASAPGHKTARIELHAPVATFLLHKRPSSGNYAATLLQTGPVIGPLLCEHECRMLNPIFFARGI